MEISEEQRLDEIRGRYHAGDPLNLSAIQVECPHLLEGLFDPAGFRGWRETLEAAGVDVERMVVSPLVEVECLHCGYRDASISRHLADMHSQTAAEYRRDFRTGETQSEEMRSVRMGLRHGRPGMMVMPHWEPAWSELYALDRLHYCHLRGHPMNRAYWTSREPGLEGYLRRLFVHWEPALEAIGLDPDQERSSPKIVHDKDHAKIRNRLREAYTNDPHSLRPFTAHAKGHGALLRSAILAYGTFESALADAGIDPAALIPELEFPAEIEKRDRMLDACRSWLRERKVRDESALAALFAEYDVTMRTFYGRWRTVIAQLGSSPKVFFRSLSAGDCPTPEAVIAALQARERAGLPMDSESVSLDAVGLRIDVEKHFGSLVKACEAAGITRRGRNFATRHYKEPEEVLSTLRRWHQDGRSLYAVDLLETNEGRTIHKWAIRYFGEFQTALKKAGLDIDGRKRHSFPERVRYPDAASVIEGIHARHRAGLGLERTAVMTFLANEGDATLVKAACRDFGSWKAALLRAELPPT